MQGRVSNPPHNQGKVVMNLIRFIKQPILLLIVTSFALIAGLTYAEETQSCKVTSIVDGRTIKIKTKELPDIVTLAGIKDVTKAGKRYLFKALMNKDVTIHVVRSKDDHVSAYVIRTKDDLFINEQLLRNGFSKYKKCSKQELNARMAKAQAMAKEAGLGVWQSNVEQGKKDVVYKAKSGSKYHRFDCRYLSESRLEIKREEAVKYYEPCKVCQP